MAVITIAKPQFGTREVTIEIPDALVDMVSRDKARDLSSKGLDVARVAAERAQEAAMSAREQATPRLASVSASTAAAATKAVNTGGRLAKTTREDWVPAALDRIEDARPVVSEALYAGTARAGEAAIVAGATAAMGARAARDTSARAVRTAAGATGSAITQVFSLFFWLGVVVWLLIRIFRPEPHQREELYARVRQMTGLEF
jgi:hypothetical protein